MIRIKEVLRGLLGPYLSVDEILALHPKFHNEVEATEKDVIMIEAEDNRIEKDAMRMMEEVGQSRKRNKRRANAVAMFRKITK